MEDRETMYALTECMSDIKSDEIPIFIYKMGINNINEKHSENAKIVSDLRRLNGYKNIIIFFENYIASFFKISLWGEYSYILEENRTIDITKNHEKKLLERLIGKDILNKYNKKEYMNSDTLYEILEKRNIYNKNGVTIKRGMKFDININNAGNIIIGFDSLHNFFSSQNIINGLRNKSISKNTKLVDYNTNYTYSFWEEADFTISDKTEYLGGISIKDYYKNKRQEKLLENVPDSLKAVIVKNKNGNELCYSPTFLYKVCDFGSLPKNVLYDFQRNYKMKPDEKMRYCLRNAYNILSSSQYIKISNNSFKIQSLGYEKFNVPVPNLMFGLNRISNRVDIGLNNGGVYEKKPISIHYFVDPELLKDKDDLNNVTSFLNELENISKKLGVEIYRDKVSNKIDLKKIDTSNVELFSLGIKKIIDAYKSTTVFILTETNMQNFYNVIKKEFGYFKKISTQGISFETIQQCLKYKETDSARRYTIYNILLGIYAKSGVQPWILKSELHSDCFIGLDVSRENGIDTAGIVQIIGKDGRVLKTNIIKQAQKGEKIKLEVLRDVIISAKNSYENFYKRPLNHITFHRDGICREDLNSLEIIANNINVKFDYIEITKDVRRRMAVYSKKEECYRTEIGCVYQKDNIAYITTTEPRDFMGMAQPLRICHVYGSTDIKDIVQDIFHLTYMNIASVIKVRLPITTYFADLSSTYGSKGFMPESVEGNYLPFV